MSTRPRSTLLQAVHETEANLDRHGFIDKRRMQKIEALLKTSDSTVRTGTKRTKAPADRRSSC